MIKAALLLDLLCTKNDFRFICGKVNPNLPTLYKHMHPKMLHYVPTINVTAALGIAIGVAASGHKSIVICNDEDLDLLLLKLKSISTIKFPIIFMVNTNRPVGEFKLPHVTLDTIATATFDKPTFLLVNVMDIQ